MIVESWFPRFTAEISKRGGRLQQKQHRRITVFESREYITIIYNNVILQEKAAQPIKQKEEKRK
jgi:hypothetical protein